MRILTLSQLSLAGSSGIAEAKIPLWWADGTNVTLGNTTMQLICDGSTNKELPPSITSASALFTLSSNVPSTQKFALECTLFVTSSSATATAQLYDHTAQSSVSSASVSTTSTTATVVRSGQFTLIPGHQYGVGIVTTNASYLVELSDASLIIFP